MKFVVSSTDLLSHLSAVSKVISSKNTMPILDNLLFSLSEAELTVTASDLESTLITSMELDNTEGDGIIAIPAKLLIDTLNKAKGRLEKKYQKTNIPNNNNVNIDDLVKKYL